ncbi:hypothetical protein L209DRAFT_747132 [Thermothelomyces heterothallicus CBS 203.75]
MVLGASRCRKAAGAWLLAGSETSIRACSRAAQSGTVRPSARFWDQPGRGSARCNPALKRRLPRGATESVSAQSYQ